MEIQHLAYASDTTFPTVRVLVPYMQDGSKSVVVNSLDDSGSVKVKIYFDTREEAYEFGLAHCDRFIIRDVEPVS